MEINLPKIILAEINKYKNEQHWSYVKFLLYCHLYWSQQKSGIYGASARRSLQSWVLWSGSLKPKCLPHLNNVPICGRC